MATATLAGVLVVLVLVPTGAFGDSSPAHPAVPRSTGPAPPEVRAAPAPAPRPGAYAPDLATEDARAAEELTSGAPPSDRTGTAPAPGSGPTRSVPPAELDRWLAPILSGRPGVPQVYRPTGGPSDLNLSGTTFDLITTDTTVRNITISGNATLEVARTSTRPTLTMLGNLEMTGNAVLFLNHSNLVEPETYDFEQNAILTNDATIVTLGANETSGGWQWGLTLHGSANLTILDSNWSFPGSWTVTEFNDHSSGLFGFSLVLSDLLFLELPAGSSFAHLHTVVALGFNVWLSFAGGERANLTLPANNGWRNWSFPGSLPVSGVGYTIGLYYSYVSVFSLMVWQGSNVSLHDSPDALISLEMVTSALSLKGLNESHYWHWGLYRADFALSLRNVTVYTWNLYPFAGSLAVADSTVGELQVYGNASAVVRSSTLDGRGGYYGNQGTSTFVIFDSSIAAQVVGYSAWTELVNCTFTNLFPTSVLALGSAQVELVDTYPTATRSLSATGLASVLVAWTVHLNDTLDGAPVAQTSFSMSWSSNSTQAATGAEVAILPQWRLEASGRTFSENYSLATWGSDAANQSAIDVQRALWLSPALVPIVRGLYPANGSMGLPQDQNATIHFAFPMEPSATQAAVSVVPQVPFTPTWDASSRNLSLAFPDVWPYNTSVTVSVGTGAETTGGSPLTWAWQSTFQVEPAPSSPPRPKVLSTDPGNGSSNIWVGSDVVVNFTQPMVATPTTEAFSISPSVKGSVVVGGHELVFTHSSDLAAYTAYLVEIGPGAMDTNFTGFGTTFELEFTTGAAPPPASGHNATGPVQNSTGAPAWYDNPNVVAAVVAVVLVVALALFLLSRRRPSGAATAESTPAAQEESPSAPSEGDGTPATGSTEGAAPPTAGSKEAPTGSKDEEP
jgi:hypothetical protein